MRPTAVEESKASSRRVIVRIFASISPSFIYRKPSSVKRNEIENEGWGFIFYRPLFLGRGTCAACGDRSSYCAPLVGGTVFSLCSLRISADATESDPRTQNPEDRSWWPKILSAAVGASIDHNNTHRKDGPQRLPVQPVLRRTYYCDPLGVLAPPRRRRLVSVFVVGC